jgi:hypothetical protein
MTSPIETEHRVDRRERVPQGLRAGRELIRQPSDSRTRRFLDRIIEAGRL